jgi:hypothetical protein
MDIEGSRIFGLLAVSSKPKPIINETKGRCKGKKHFSSLILSGKK